MIKQRMLSIDPVDCDRNADRVKQFLVDKFGAKYCDHVFLDNLITLDGEIWWVASSSSEEGVEVYTADVNTNTSVDANIKFVNELEKLGAGILVLRQLVDYQLCVYLIDDLSLLEPQSEKGFFLDWEKVEEIKRFSEMGIVLDNELPGFRVFRRARYEAVHSMSEEVKKSLTAGYYEKLQKRYKQYPGKL